MSSRTPPMPEATAEPTTSATTASSTTAATTATTTTAETMEASTNVARTEASSSSSEAGTAASDNVRLPTLSTTAPTTKTTSSGKGAKGPSGSKSERLSTVSFSTLTTPGATVVSTSAATPGASSSGTKGVSYARENVRPPAMSSAKPPRPRSTVRSTGTATTKATRSGSIAGPTASKNVRHPVMSSSPASTTATSSGSKAGPLAMKPSTSGSTSRITSSRSRAGPSRSRMERIPVEVKKGINGLEKVVLRQGLGSSAEVYLYGAQVMSWKNDHGEELLFVSNKALFKPPKPIRGGIPLCFPQVSSYGPFERDGFAKSRFWSIDPNPPPLPRVSSTGAFVDLILKPTEEDMRTWPHSYEFRLRVRLSPAGDLLLASRIRNTNKDGKPFSFAFAYHPYFSVSDIGEVRVEGLETQSYLDNLQNRKRFTGQGDSITFESEIDKVYVEVPTKILIMDHEKRTTYIICTDGLPDAVVWNPWDKKAKAMADFGNEEYQRMLCVASGVVEKTITLKPGQEWKARQELSFVRSSYYDGPPDPRKARGGSLSKHV